MMTRFPSASSPRQVVVVLGWFLVTMSFILSTLFVTVVYAGAQCDLCGKGNILGCPTSVLEFTDELGNARKNNCKFWQSSTAFSEKFCVERLQKISVAACCCALANGTLLGGGFPPTISPAPSTMTLVKKPTSTGAPGTGGAYITPTVPVRSPASAPKPTTSAATTSTSKISMMMTMLTGLVLVGTTMGVVVLLG